MMITDYMD